MTALWENGTKKAFYGYVAQLAIALIGGIIVDYLTPTPWEILMGADATPALIAAIIVAIAGIAALVYHILGLKDMKNAAAGTNLEVATQRLWLAAILGICGSVFTLISVIIGSLITLAGFIIAWTGYAQIKTNGTDESARTAGSKLVIFAILTVVAGVVTIIPGFGDFFANIINVVALYFAYVGWKSLAESRLA